METINNCNYTNKSLEILKDAGLDAKAAAISFKEYIAISKNFGISLNDAVSALKNISNQKADSETIE